MSQRRGAPTLRQWPSTLFSDHNIKTTIQRGIGREAVQGLIAMSSWSSHADFGSESQIEVGHGKKAIVIFVPVPSLQGFHRVQQR